MLTVSQNIAEHSTYIHSKPPLVSIGLPVYNRPEMLRGALQALTAQSFTNLEILVSDDCSPGEQTRKVVQEFMEHDSRIQYYRQKKNLGSILNHKVIFEKATGEYFFWASEDDEWEETFIETGVTTLSANLQYAAWCCTIDNIDRFGRVIREYPGFSRFTSTRHKVRDIIRYLLEPEVMGKANLFHGIYRRSALADTIAVYFFNNARGSDMCFNLAFLARFDLIATDEVLFHKRIERATDQEQAVDPIIIKDPSRHLIPLQQSLRYLYENYKAAPGFYKPLVIGVLGLRMPLVMRNFIAEQTLKGFFQKLIRKIGCKVTKGERA